MGVRLLALLEVDYIIQQENEEKYTFPTKNREVRQVPLPRVRT